jgi:hypothetical protein
MVTVSFLFIENSDLLIGSKQIAGFVYVDSIIHSHSYKGMLLKHLHL